MAYIAVLSATANMMSLREVVLAVHIVLEFGGHTVNTKFRGPERGLS
jgi:hypothetical protein